MTVTIGKAAAAKDALLLKTAVGTPPATFHLDILMTIWLVIVALVALAVSDPVPHERPSEGRPSCGDDFLPQIP